MNDNFRCSVRVSGSLYSEWVNHCLAVQNLKVSEFVRDSYMKIERGSISVDQEQTNSYGYCPSFTHSSAPDYKMVINLMASSRIRLRTQCYALMYSSSSTSSLIIEKSITVLSINISSVHVSSSLPWSRVGCITWMAAMKEDLIHPTVVNYLDTLSP